MQVDLSAKKHQEDAFIGIGFVGSASAAMKMICVALQQLDFVSSFMAKLVGRSGNFQKTGRRRMARPWTANLSAASSWKGSRWWSTRAWTRTKYFKIT